MNECCILPESPLLNYPHCDYLPPVVKKLLMRKIKDKYQVKINGKGKWIDCEFDEERMTIRFVA